MEENRSTFKLSGREKAGLIWHYLRPCWGHFAAALLCACLSMALNALTPQIIRITVDSILGSEEAKLPALLRVLPLETLRQEPVTALWWAAGAVMVTALLRGLCSFGQRAQLSRGSEAYVKGLTCTGASSICPLRGTSSTPPATSSSAAPPMWT